jgi:hypothetical protein
MGIGLDGRLSSRSSLGSLTFQTSAPTRGDLRGRSHGLDDPKSNDGLEEIVAMVPQDRTLHAALFNLSFRGPAASQAQLERYLTNP